MPLILIAGPSCGRRRSTLNGGLAFEHERRVPVAPSQTEQVPRVRQLVVDLEKIAVGVVEVDALLAHVLGILLDDLESEDRGVKLAGSLDVRHPQGHVAQPLESYHRPNYIRPGERVKRRRAADAALAMLWRQATTEVTDEVRIALRESRSLRERRGGGDPGAGRRGRRVRLDLDRRARRGATPVPVPLSILAERSHGLGARGLPGSGSADLAGVHRLD